MDTLPERKQSREEYALVAGALITHALSVGEKKVEWYKDIKDENGEMVDNGAGR